MAACLEILNRLRDFHVFPISGRERQQEFASRGVGRVLAERGADGIEYTVFPAADGGDDFRLDRLDIDLDLRAGRGAHQHMNARQHRFRKLHIELGTGAVEDPLEDFLQLDADFGVVAFARQVDQAGIETRSEEHTSELQSLTNLVCRLLLEKKNNSASPETLCAM